MWILITISMIDMLCECICVEFSPLNRGVIPYPFKLLLKNKNNSDVSFAYFHEDKTVLFSQFMNSYSRNDHGNKCFVCMGGACHSQGK